MYKLFSKSHKKKHKDKIYKDIAIKITVLTDFGFQFSF